MTISIIAAIDRNRGIGYRNDLLFHISNDLKRFKALTTGHTVLMGRKTFQSLPKGALPNRRNLVVTSNPELSFPQAECFPSIGKALEACAADEHVFVIGGASIYGQAMPLADSLFLTEIDAEARDVDVYFPDFDPGEWVEKSRETHLADEKFPHAYAFVDYVRAPR